MQVNELKEKIERGEIDTVLLCMVDMQGRLIGKRIQAQFFAESGFSGTHACNYLLALDMDMEPVPGYEVANWQDGYGDFELKPDMQTLRILPWLERTAMIICDIVDHHGHDVEHSPRAMLKRQLQRIAEKESVSMIAQGASELEFYLFDETYETAHQKNFCDLKTIGNYIEDYHIFQTSKEESVMQDLRNGLQGAGIPVENSKGEWGPGQEEINIRYAPLLDMADRHTILKNAAKEIAHGKNKAITFMAKWNYDLAGSSCHIHLSLWSQDGKKPLFFDPNAKDHHGMSEMMRQFLAGLLKHTGEIMYFLAPYVNSYKRFQASTFAPTKVAWSRDNRTTGYRICAEMTSALRIECRIGGADLNPYLAYTALLAAGLAGIDKKMELEPEFRGDAYFADNLRKLPATLREATELMKNSALLKEALGELPVRHYTRTAEWEQFESDRRVTDWELRRGFERG